MKIVIEETYEAMSEKAALDLLQLAGDMRSPLICTASGDTPAGLFRNLVKFNKERFHADDWYFVGLDEWVGKNEEDEGSCGYYLYQQLYHPLDVKKDRLFCFNGRAASLEDELKKMEAFIAQHGGIDIAVVGLGVNGHIGFNEPGVSPDLTTHIIELEESTRQVGQKYFKEKQELTQGITIGLKTLLQARYVFLLVSGSHKATIVQKIVESPVTNELPGTILKQHPQLHIYLDREAAALLDQSTISHER